MPCKKKTNKWKTRSKQHTNTLCDIHKVCRNASVSLFILFYFFIRFTITKWYTHVRYELNSCSSKHLIELCEQRIWMLQIGCYSNKITNTRVSVNMINIFLWKRFWYSKFKWCVQGLQWWDMLLLLINLFVRKFFLFERNYSLFMTFDIKYPKNIDCLPVFGQKISTSFENSTRD